MRKHKKLIVALLTIAAMVAMIVPAGFASAGTWAADEITSTAIPEERLDHVFVLPSNSDYAWVVGEANDDTTNPTLAMTTDGGDTWTNPTTLPTTKDIDGIVFTDTDKGWLVGSKGTFLKTTDGGDTWSAVDPAPTTQSMYDIEFTSDGTEGCIVGWAKGDFSIARSTDSGATWTAQALTAGPSGLLINMTMGTDDVWYATGKTGTLQKTTDGGANWSVVTTIPTMDPIPFLFDCSAYGADNLYIAMQNGGVLVSDDGGATFTNIPTGTTGATILKAIQATSATEVWAAGGAGKLLHSMDSGATWTTVTTGVAADFQSMSFVDKEIGYVVGTDGKVIRLVYTPAPPVAGFTTDATDDTAVVDTEITFTNSTTGADSYSWDFGDDSDASTEANPTHTYEEVGTYTVTLTATNEDGTDTETLEITITGAGCCASAAATAADIGSGMGLIGMLGLVVTFFHIRKKKTL